MVHIEYGGPVVHGTFLKRYKRFFVDVRLNDGQEVTAHTSNTGRMTGMLEPGNQVLLTKHDDPKRKLKFSLQAILVGTTWIGANPIFANRIVAAVFASPELSQLGLAQLDEYTQVRREVTTDAGPGGRIDFLLSGHKAGLSDCFVEVKSVTLRRGDLAAFPDAVSERGLRHIAVLRAIVEAGGRGALCYLVQRDDCKCFAPARSVDPVYADALLEAHQAGVEVFALLAQVGPAGIDVETTLPLDLQAPA